MKRSLLCIRLVCDVQETSLERFFSLEKSQLMEMMAWFFIFVIEESERLCSSALVCLIKIEAPLIIECGWGSGVIWGIAKTLVIDRQTWKFFRNEFKTIKIYLALWESRKKNALCSILSGRYKLVW